MVTVPPTIAAAAGLVIETTGGWLSTVTVMLVEVAELPAVSLAMAVSV
jgi:hypothetical protein